MIALDLFAGTGWGVACQWLGIEEYGVEIMPEAIASRDANGMRTIYPDVWEGLSHDLIESRNGYGREAAEAMAARGVSFREIYEVLVASPPCQTFSLAGGGAGRKALDEVLALIDAKAYRDVAALRAFGEKHDPRTSLVLTPLAHVYRDVPTYVVFEQVPPVLPVWERCAEEMRAWGYSVWTGNLQAEEYGVPQTRKRAVLIARADGIEAAPPAPTHNRYNHRAPHGGRNADPSLLPWVSMAEALGWGMDGRPFVTAGNAVGRAEGVGGSGAKRTLEREKDRGAWVEPVMRSNYGTGGDASARGERVAAGTAATVTSKADRNKWVVTGGATTEMYGERSPEVPAPPITGARNTYYGEGERFTRATDGKKTKSTTARSVTIEEAAALQSYPPGFVFCGTKTKQFLQVGNAVPPLLAEAILKGFLS